ncbi:type II toxin-antitoxin system VapC family toxin [candidate division WS5 bacterium]|uniref:Type II toxin-antitoxin system VapC family toxin n=1 Tax=candidate division WS5 bacterium TaxID=2093353 RepID=A0A419DEV5_9BACT|nr:MAG: type II toxin-antitoxin system VapC family toxin [candidate division WS5 bacterium]
MILVDTSIWISHFREGNSHLKKLLLDELVVCHPFIIGELACGHLKNREEIISLLKSLPKARTVENDEILHFIDNRKLMGLGIGLIDVHLLASSLLTNTLLWTADKQLSTVSSKLNILYRQQ